MLASVSAPWPRLDRGRVGFEEDAARPELPLLDRVRYGQYPPGSTFKLVTAAAALRASSDVAERHFECKPLPDGRVGMQLPRWRRPIRDDATDHTAHGDVTLDEGLRVSCNAYFAQLGLAVGPRTLKDTADAFEIATSVGGHGRRSGPAAAVGVVRPGRSARLAVPDGAGGGDDGGTRRDAGRAAGCVSPAHGGGARRAGSSSRRRPTASPGRCGAS